MTARDRVGRDGAGAAFGGVKRIGCERLSVRLINHSATAGTEAKAKQEQHELHASTSCTEVAPNPLRKFSVSVFWNRGSLDFMQRKKRVWLASLNSGTLKTG